MLYMRRLKELSPILPFSEIENEESNQEIAGMIVDRVLNHLRDLSHTLNQPGRAGVLEGFQGAPFGDLAAMNVEGGEAVLAMRAARGNWSQERIQDNIRIAKKFLPEEHRIIQNLEILTEK